MKQLLFAIVFFFLSSSYADAQELEKQAPAGFDSLRTGIPQGKIDTISYASKTVGVTRRALIYTPPAFSKKEKISGAVPVAWYRR